MRSPRSQRLDGGQSQTRGSASNYNGATALIRYIVSPVPQRHSERCQLKKQMVALGSSKLATSTSVPSPTLTGLTTIIHGKSMLCWFRSCVCHDVQIASMCYPTQPLLRINKHLAQFVTRYSPWQGSSLSVRPCPSICVYGLLSVSLILTSLIADAGGNWKCVSVMLCPLPACLQA